MEYKYIIGTKENKGTSYIFVPKDSINVQKKRQFVKGIVEASTEKEAKEIFKRICKKYKMEEVKFQIWKE